MLFINKHIDSVAVLYQQRAAEIYSIFINIFQPQVTQFLPFNSLRAKVPEGKHAGDHSEGVTRGRVFRWRRVGIDGVRSDIQCLITVVQ